MAVKYTNPTPIPTHERLFLVQELLCAINIMPSHSHYIAMSYLHTSLIFLSRSQT